MLLRLQSKITFTKANNDTVVLRDFVNGMSTTESYENLTDTFKITVPHSIKARGMDIFNGENPLFERGDEVKAEMGYFPNMVNVFNGYVSMVSAKIPTEIMCEDDMFLLKNINITFPSKRHIQTNRISKKGKVGKRLKKPKIIIDKGYTLDEMLNVIIPDDIEYECPDVFLGKTAYTNVSISRILDDLKTKLGLYSYFRDGKLHVGLASNAATTTTHEFVFNEVVPWGVIDDSELEYQLAKDIKLKVVAKLLGDNNTYEELTVGDSDGAQRSFFMYWDGKTKKPDLKTFAELKLKDARYDGFRGSFETFGYKYVRHGDIVKFTDKKLPERDGSYLVVSVKREFGMNGYKQTIELGNRVG